MLVEALVPQSAVKTLDQSVLHGLSGRDVMPFDTAILLPCEHSVGGEFRAVVTDHHAGIAATLGNGIQFAGDAFAGERVVDDGCKTFSAIIIDHAEDAEAPAIDERIGDKVEGPALVRVLRDRYRCPCAQSPFPATTFANRQPLFLVEAVKPDVLP